MNCWGRIFDAQAGTGNATDRLSPVDVPGLAGGMTGLSAGKNHTCAVTQEGVARCWPPIQGPNSKAAGSR